MDSQNNQEQNKRSFDQASEKGLVNQGSGPLAYFSKDKTFAFIHQKVEKLVAAVYLLTNSLDQEEPMKWSLRGIGTDLLRLNIDLNNGASRDMYSTERALVASVVEAVSLLEVASMSGLISEMNFSILKREFSAVLLQIKNASEKHSLEGILSHESAEDAGESSGGEYSRSDRSEKVSLNTPRLLSDDQKAVSRNSKDIYVNTDIVSDTKTSNPEESNSYSRTKSKPLSEYSPVAVKKNRRQSIIINLLKRKKEIMVKDVSAIVQDCSEKTLQRELSDLVTQGVLKKEGERRWTKYSLV